MTAIRGGHIQTTSFSTQWKAFIIRLKQRIINLLPYLDNLKRKDGTVYDEIRKKWVKLTGEELVRQLFIKDLIIRLHYGSGRIAIERQIHTGNTSQRFDIVIYDDEGKPFILVECKSFETPLEQSAAFQAARYNLLLKAPYLAVTNGMINIFARLDFSTGAINFIPDLPNYPK